MLAGGFTGPETGTAAVADGSRFYVKKDTWPETLLASRASYARWWQARRAGVRLGPWHTTERKEPFSPETPADPDARDPWDNRLWDARYDLLDGVVHYDLSNHGIDQQRRLPGQTGGGGFPQSAFLHQIRTLEVERPTRVTAYLGAEYGLELWLNGKRLFSDARLGNGLAPEVDQAEVELPLLAGKNQLVLRFLDVRRSGFYFSIVPHEQIHPDPIRALLEQIRRDFPVETDRVQADVSWEELVAWFRRPGEVDLLGRLADRAMRGLEEDAKTLQEALKDFRKPEAEMDRRQCLDLIGRAARFRQARSRLELVNLRALRMAVADLQQTFPDRCTEARRHLQLADAWEKRLPDIDARLGQGDETAIDEVARLVAFQREALLSNPLLDFDLLVVLRKPLGDPRRPKGPDRGMGEFFGLAQQSAWQLDRIRQPYGWENEIAVLSDLRGEARLTTLYRPPAPRLISDLDLHFDADRMLLSMPGSHFLWQVFEIDARGSRLRQVSLGDQPDVHNFDACYLPNGKIAFVSTAALQGVPCSNGIAVATNYVMDADGRNVRQLCFDQDHDYCPTLMNDGRILYLRWDYTDLPHQWPRILFTMNPDGTCQREYYGSNSYWPNAIFFARPVPDHPTKVAGIVTGHHVGRVGELVIFDPAAGRQEADGVVQRIPGYGQKVEPIIMDKLTIDSWPKFSHPFPLSEKYLVVAAKPTPGALWGIYLVDVFDNLVLLKEVEGRALFEPIPFRRTATPPVIPQRIEPDRKDAVVYLEDVYRGPGLAGVPRGTVKRLRVFSYHFAYPYKSGGQHRVGSDGPWEPKRILGTVPVEADGSAMFRVPANTPISVHPLDAEGKAVQLMRSWMTAMPGEVLSCVGCHDSQNTAPIGRGSIAARKKPVEIEPWYGPVRGFSFKNEVQPVLDRHCVSCHDGSRQYHGRTLCDLRGDRDAYVVLEANNPQPQVIRGVGKEELVKKYSGVFEPSYFELRRLVRVGGLESDLHLLRACEFHADTTELFQMLRNGHYGVELDAEAWERLATWVDLNAPCHGTWRDVLGLERTVDDDRRRRELRQLYANVDDDPEALLETSVETDPPVESRPIPEPASAEVACPGWPFDAEEARRRQAAAGPEPRKILDLGDGVELELVLIPPGQFPIGAARGFADQQPATPVTIDTPFWIGRCEITNRQYARFDPVHDSRHEHGTASFNSERARGPLLNLPEQPVVRISWSEATAFCRWLSEKTGREVTLPTEAQWEYACRAGSAEEFFYGGLDADFSPFANLADATINTWAYFNERRRSADQVPRDERFNDGALVTVEVGRYRPNAWGLHDVHGNAWEWTRSTYRPYPYRDDDGRNAPTAAGRKVARGGSWYDRPTRCVSAFRLDYPAWQKVYNVGFRVVIEGE